MPTFATWFYIFIFATAHSLTIVPFRLTMSTAEFATYAEQANTLSPEFLEDVRSATTSFLEFFNCHRATLTNLNMDHGTLETEVWEKAVSNYCFIFPMALSF